MPVRRPIEYSDSDHAPLGWKSIHYVRDTEEAMTEVYPKLMAPGTQWQVYREYYCPSCVTMHDVEAPTPWYPVIPRLRARHRGLL